MLITTIVAATLSLQGVADAPAVQVSTSEAAPSAAAQHDPAALLNYGAQLVEQGRIEEARQVFDAVRRMKVDYTLETVDGRWVYPPDLARAALRQLDRGESRTLVLAARN